MREQELTDIGVFLDLRLAAKTSRLPAVCAALAFLVEGIGAALSPDGLFAVAAMGVGCCAISTLLHAAGRRRNRARRAAIVFAAPPVLLGLEIMLEYLGWKTSWLVDGASLRVSVNTALSLVFIGSALILANSTTLRLLRVSHLLALGGGTVAFLSLVGNLYGVAGLMGLGIFPSMAPHNAVAYVLLALGALFVRLDHDLVAVLVSEGPGAYVARRLLPLAVALPMLIGWFRLAGERVGMYSLEFGTSAFVTLTMVSFVAVTWWTAVQLQTIELERRNAERERERLAAEALIRERFVSMLGHDLRNPLTAAKAGALLLRRLSPAKAAPAHLVEQILCSVERTDRMVQDLLDSLRFRAGHPILIRPRRFDLAREIDEALRDLRLVHGERIAFRSDGPVEGYWDRHALRRALENLVNNATKYGEPGGQVTVTLSRAGERVRLSVHNRGNPIAPQRISGLFEPFRRDASAEQAGKPGWGIGLTVVQGVAEAHHGRVEVESAAESGTMFTLELPLDSRGAEGASRAA